MIKDGVITLQFELDAERDAPFPGSDEHFESALRPATVGRLSLRAAVRATLVLPYAVEVRVQPEVGAEAEGAATTVASETGRPREFAVVVTNDPDSSAPYSRFAAKGVSLVRELPAVSDDIVLQFDPGEYFFELRKGTSLAEVEHPVALNRVSFFAERQAAGR